MESAPGSRRASWSVIIEVIATIRWKASDKPTAKGAGRDHTYIGKTTGGQIHSEKEVGLPLKAWDSVIDEDVIARDIGISARD